MFKAETFLDDPDCNFFVIREKWLGLDLFWPELVKDSVFEIVFADEPDRIFFS